ncbi:MAG: hypothetical protein MPJ50_17780 [Pirellulales bacterium]|nr:hypothetical protein [Pirellulales bacterium]
MNSLASFLSLATSGLFESAVISAVVSLGIASLIIGTSAWLVSRFVTTATWRKAVWQLALVSVACLLILEVTGVSGSCGDWIRTLTILSKESDITPATMPTQARDIPLSRGGHGHENQTSLSLAPPINWWPPRSGDFADSDRGKQFFDSDVESDGTLFERATGVDDLDSPPIVSAGDSPWSEDALGPSAKSSIQLPLKPWEPKAASQAATWFGFAWGIVGIALLARSLGGRVLLWRFALSLETNQNPNLARMAEDIAHRLKCRRPLTIKTSAKLAGPLAFGMIWPTLALPANFRRQFTPEGQQAVLVHEIAHLRHRDPFWLLVADLLTSLLWWNPIIWLTRAHLKHESELVADEATLCLEDGPAHLASSLFQLGSRLARPRAIGFVSANGSGLKSNLGQRIERLVNLDEDTCRPRRTRPFLRTLAVVCVIAGCLFGTSWARPRLPIRGDSNVSSFQRNWRTSFAGAALAALLVGSPAPAGAQDVGPPKPGDAQGTDEAKADATRRNDEIKMLEVEMEYLVALKADLAAKLTQASEQVGADLESQRVQIAAEAKEIQTKMDQLAKRAAQAKEAGEAEAARKAAQELEFMQVTLAKRAKELATLQVKLSEEVKVRFAADEEALQARLANLADHLEQLRTNGDLEAAQRLQDRFAMLQRQASQRRRRASLRDEGLPSTDARQARERQDDALRRRQREGLGDVEAQIRHILAAAENLEAAGMHEQARELREMVGRRMSRPDRETGDSQPPRRPSTTADELPTEDRPRRVRRDRETETPLPGAAPRRRRAGPGVDAAPGGDRRGGNVGPLAEARDVPTGRRGGDGAVDRELLNLIRSLQQEVNSLRTEVKTLRQEMDRGRDRPRRDNRQDGPPEGGRRRPDRERPVPVDRQPEKEKTDSPPDPERITRR